MSDWKDDAFYTAHGCYVAINPNGVPVVVPEPNKEFKEDDCDEES